MVHDAVAQTAIPIGMTTGLKLANYGPLYVAARQGLFEKQGLKVTIDTGGSVAEPVAIALSGRGQFAATGTGMAVNSTLEGGRMKVIGKLPHPMTVLVSSDDRALAVSKLLNASTERIGTLNVKDPVVQQAAVDAGVQVVDISGVKSQDSTNHNRFVDAVALYPALTARTQQNGIGEAGAFVFDAAAATISSPFRLVSGALRQ